MAAISQGVVSDRDAFSGHSHSKKATSTSVGQTSSPSLPAPRLPFAIDFVGDDVVV